MTTRSAYVGVPKEYVGMPREPLETPNDGGRCPNVTVVRLHEPLSDSGHVKADQAGGACDAAFDPCAERRPFAPPTRYTEREHEQTNPQEREGNDETGIARHFGEEVLRVTVRVRDGHAMALVSFGKV